MLENKIFIIAFIIIATILWFMLWLIIWKILRYSEVKRYKLDAIKRSKSSILWEVYEKILPFLKDFSYNPKDMVFIWKWFDYLVLDWLANWDIKEIIFLEIKSGTSSLNKNERMIKNALKWKNIKYEEFRIN